MNAHAPTACGGTRPAGDAAPRILVAIPVFNEQRYVASVLSRVLAQTPEVLVIDDGSTDDTPLLLARQPVEVIRHAVNRGYGQSMIDAFRWASCYGYDWLVTMDCDEQHEPESLPDFFQAAASGDCDVISGSRYLSAPDDGQHPPADRRAINRTITTLVNDCLGLRLTDAFCGFKAYRVRALSRLELSERGYAFPLQFWVQAAAQRLRIRELPVRLIYNDPTRSFGGPLNDADRRLQHYLDVFEREKARFPDRFTPSAPCVAGRIDPHSPAAATTRARRR